MEYTKEDGEKSTVKLTIKFSEEEWQEAVAAAYKKVRGHYTVPGFRKGKAPMNMLANYYGRSIFYEDALDELYKEHYHAIIEKEKDNFSPVSGPDLDIDGDLDTGDGFTMIATVPVYPTITLDAYTGLKIKKFEYPVTEEDVDNSVKNMLSSKAEKKEVEGREAKSGDVVNIDYIGTMNGVPFEGGSAEEQDLELGSERFIPGFEEQVVGMKKGETKTILVTFPEDYPSEEVAGKDAEFKVTVNKINETVYPELTDELAKESFGEESAKALRQKRRESLEKDAKRRSENDTQDAILVELAEHVVGDIPDAMIEDEMDDEMESYGARMEMYQGISLDDYLKYAQMDRNQFREYFREEAVTRTKATLAMRYIIDKEKIEVTEEEMDAKVAEMAAEVDKKPEDMELSDSRKSEIRQEMLYDKFIAFVEGSNEMCLDLEKDGDEKSEKKEEKAEKSKGKKKAKKEEAEEETGENESEENKE